jgi:hypothetical protein
VALPEGMLFVELARVVNGWLRHSDMIHNKPGLEFGCFGKLAVKNAKGRMENIAGGRELLA